MSAPHETAAPTRVDAPIRTIVAETLTPEAFAPFGEILTHKGLQPLPIQLYGDLVNTYKLAAIEADQPLEWLLVEGRLREFEIVFLERHFGVSQAFVPLGGNPFVISLAAPDCRLQDDVPAPEEVHAFIVPGDAGVQIHKGTWHEPPFALVDGSCLLATSHRALTEGLMGSLDSKGGIAHQGVANLDVDKRNILERSGTRYKVQLP